MAEGSEILKDRISFLEQQVELLDESNRWYFLALDSFASLGELQSGLNQDREPEFVFLFTQTHLNKLFPFETVAFCLTEPESAGHRLVFCNPDAKKASMEKQLRYHKDNGNFGYALNWNQPFCVENSDRSKMHLHPLITKSSVVGMFMGHVNEDFKDLLPREKKVLSVILQHIAYTLENLFLHKFSRDLIMDRGHLSEREKQIARLLCINNGITDQELAGQLCISIHTVRSHLKNIFRKLEVKNRLQMISLLNRHQGPVATE
ncbi:MAG: response regulator transcription factor [Nitrospinales bacterium]